MVRTPDSRSLPFITAAMLLGLLVSVAPLSRSTAQQTDSAAGPESYSAPELVRRLAEQLDSIDSLECEYRLDFVDKGDDAKTTTSQRRFVRSGKRWLSAEIDSDGHRESRRLFDGDTVFSYRVDISAAGEQLEGTVQLDAPRELPLLTPDAFLGIDLSNLRRSAVSVLRRADLELSREKLEDGKPGFRLAARQVGSNGWDAQSSDSKIKPQYKVEVLLDPAHGMLPREQLITEDAQAITWPDWKQHVKVQAFREVIDERANKVRWFPFSAVLEQQDSAPDIHFTVIKLRVNPELPSARFELEIPDGTRCMDTRVHGPGTVLPTKGKRKG